tara:strand:- start:315 stop:980 length:666 start_codon:yes stop_codon:yes gene_type:complete
MNVQEFSEFELHRHLSVLARLIYAFYLKQQVLRSGSSQIQVDFNAIQKQVGIERAKDELSVPDHQKIAAALHALAQTRLLNIIAQDTSQSMTVLLPLCPQSTQQKNPMNLAWKPLPQIQDYLRLYGVLDQKVSQEDLQSFIVYWIARPEVQETGSVWTQKLAQHIRHQRAHAPVTAAAEQVEQVGFQTSHQPKYAALNQQTVEKIKRDFAHVAKAESKYES